MTNHNHDDTISEYRVSNFNAGPAALPLDILAKVQREFVNFDNTGMSICETSHRSKTFQDVMNKATANYTTLLDIPNSHELVFSQGGGTGQTAAILYNSVDRVNGWSAYVVSGTWSQKAADEASKLGFRREIVAEMRLDALPQPTQWASSVCTEEFSEECFNMPSTAPSLLHHCSNETIHGLEYHCDVREEAMKVLPCSWGTSNTVWSMDASSNFCSKHIKCANYDIIYAGAQKNVGTSGITVAILNSAQFKSGPKTKECPSILDYSLLMKNKSLHTTIPVFPMYLTGLIADDLIAKGGLHAAEERAKAKSDLLYDFIDGSDGFYACPVKKSSRSRMNHIFRISNSQPATITIADETLEAKFVSEATDRGLVGLKGHRSVGGLRASIYNSVTMTDVEKLISFMAEFKDKYETN